MTKFKLLKLVYVASPYTAKGYPKELKKTVERQRANLVTKIIGKLQDSYQISFIGPITQSHHTAKHMDSKTGKFSCWRDIDLTYITACKKMGGELWVVTMEGWDKSTGVLAEIKYAEELGIPVKYVDPKTLEVSSNDPVFGLSSC